MGAVVTGSAGTGPGERQLNGPQTTGRDYHDLSQPTFSRTTDLDVAAPMRDGVSLLVDVHRPVSADRFPVLVSASPYPRQIQDLGAPMGFIEAGATDFFVPRGYVHVIANVRGTGGSGGEFGFFDGQERQDMHDLVEWAATKPWSDGNVGMVGISYFAMTQLEAAVERPEHLRAIFPIAVTTDLYEAANHHGLFSSGFVSPFLTMLGITARHGDRLWRGPVLNAMRHVLEQHWLHAKFATMDGEAAITLMRWATKLPYDAHPWDDLWQDVAVDHPLRDQWWDERDLTALLGRVEIPVYLGCDWDNVPLHLPSTFAALDELTSSPEVRVAMLGHHGLAWPWESLHIEALAWFDHWLKGRETGVLDGPRIRYVVPGVDQWESTETWPPPATQIHEFALGADGILGAAGTPGSREFVTLGEGLNRRPAKPTDPPSTVMWETDVLTSPLDLLGDGEVILHATSTASDTAWILTVQDVADEGDVQNVTAGWLRAGLRNVDERRSTPGRPMLDCRTFVAVPIGEMVEYRIPLVVNAHRFPAGHRLRLVLTSDDQSDDVPAIMGFRHASVGTSSRNTVLSSSRLLLRIRDPRP
ncbi:MAG: CocE/NonD family hydrolase [Candidatus Nanopelagicales bacterium]|nr:CocE/NonD family hydrolase [Actinomycetota bacterium]TXH31880.1 MAG: CocE/NonD family hydrolase [Actinomycetota bacterium]